MVTQRLLDNDTRRLVTLDAAHNFRDIGGYDTDDGRQTRWNVVYRADGLGALTPRDQTVVRRLHLRTVIDLRSFAELTDHGQFPHHAFTLDFEHLPILDVLWPHDGIAHFGDDREFLLWAYRDLLDNGKHRFAAAISRLARPGALPAVFHCTAGKDRTGLVAALLLSALGVRRDQVLADYALTAAGITRMIAWAERESVETAARLAATPPWYLAAHPEALDQVLDDLCHKHGTIRDYLHTIGVHEHELQHLTQQLLGPSE